MRGGGGLEGEGGGISGLDGSLRFAAGSATGRRAVNPPLLFAICVKVSLEILSPSNERVPPSFVAPSYERTTPGSTFIVSVTGGCKLSNCLNVAVPVKLTRPRAGGGAFFFFASFSGGMLRRGCCWKAGSLSAQRGGGEGCV